MGNAESLGAAITGMKQDTTIPYFARVPRREVSEGINLDNGWLVTLSDLTLLLLCFLVVWYVKNQEQKATTISVDAPAPQAPTNIAGNDASSAKDAEWQALRQEIEKFIGAAGMSRDVTITAGANEILLSFKDTVPFSSGKADLKSKALPVLEKVAAVAVSRPAMQVRISGHTDDRPIATAEFPSNWELSSARASRVARYLIQKGVHPARIAVQGFAYHHPRVPNENGSSREANRRVEIRLMRDSEMPEALNSKAGDHEHQ
jgi:chemotaxis protein MotB